MWLIFSALLSSLGSTPIWDLPPAPSIDRQAGVKGTRQLVGYWPSTAEGRPADPAGFQVVLVPKGTAPGDEWVFDAGTWLDLPTGGYIYWLESPHWMSSFVGISLRYPSEASPIAEQGRVMTVPVVPAGRIRWGQDTFHQEAQDPGDAGEPSDLDLWLLHQDSHIRRDGSFTATRMLRRVDGEQAKGAEGVSMPAGDILAGVRDRKTGEFLALRKVVIPRFDLISVLFKGLSDQESAALVSVNRPQMLTKTSEDDIQVHLLLQNGETIPPTEAVRTARRIYAFWRSLPPGTATLKVSSEVAEMKDVALELKPGKILEAEAEGTVKLTAPTVHD